MCRKRSDFDWLSSKLGLPEPKDQAGVESLLKAANHHQQVFYEPAAKVFFGCSNQKRFEAELKAAENKTKVDPKVDQSTAILLDEVDSRSKSIKHELSDVMELVSDAHSLILQLDKKLAKIAECFGKLHADWSHIEKVNESESFDLPLSELFSDLKIKNFEWCNGLKKQRDALMKAFSSGDGLITQVKELRKNLKIRREANESQKRLADEISYVQLAKFSKNLAASCQLWITCMGEAALTHVAMDKLRIAAREDDDYKRGRKTSDCAN